MKNCPNCKNDVPADYSICWSCSYNFETKKVDGFISDKIDLKSDKVKPKKIDCLRCKTTMVFEANFKLHEGTNYGIFGDLLHVFNNRVSFDVYVCPNCDKVEFFTPSVSIN